MREGPNHVHWNAYYPSSSGIDFVHERGIDWKTEGRVVCSEGVENGLRGWIPYVVAAKETACSKRRIETAIREYVVVETVVADPETATQHCFVVKPSGAIGETNSRRKVFLAGLKELIWSYYYAAVNDSGESVSTQDVVAQALLFLFERGEILVTQSQVKREIRTKLPVVLNENGIGVRAEVTLPVNWATRNRIKVNLLELRRVVCKI